MFFDYTIKSSAEKLPYSDELRFKHNMLYGMCFFDNAKTYIIDPCDVILVDSKSSKDNNQSE